MTRIKSRSPSPSGGDEELLGFDLYTPDTLTLVGSGATPTNPLKRSSTAITESPPTKRTYTASSTAARARATSGASATSKKKKTNQAQAQPKPKPVKAPKIIFGFDFGTTFSGIAYAYSIDAKKIEIMMNWDRSNKDHVKVPSVIKFTPQGDVWGIKAKNIADALRWFKLTLVNPPDLDVGIRNSLQIQDARATLQNLEMFPVDAIAAYMKNMWEHCIEKLKEAEGKETVDTSRFHVVFTVPAIWPDYARISMERAVQKAGILKRRTAGRTEHDFVSEPEAAALATLASVEGRHDIKVNDAFVVVDCGGGTVDVISYKATGMDPMVVREVVKGKGDLCGAIFLEERFKDLLFSKLQDIAPDARARILEKELQRILTHDWEDDIRSEFSGAPKTWAIHVPHSLIDVSRLDLNSGFPKFTVSSAEIEEVFRPIVEKVYSLVNRQIESVIKKEGRAPKYVILVGGFGSSNYLREYLEQRCHRVEILQRRGTEPWSAVSRGAVIHGITKLKIDTSLSIEVGSRVARASFGAICEEKWDDNEHYPEDKKWDFILQMDVSIRVMKWHILQNDDIFAGRHRSFKFTKFLSKPPEKIETYIYKSHSDPPPKRQDDSVIKEYKLTWRTHLDWESLDFFDDQKETFRKLEYEVQMECSAGPTVFSIYHGGRKQASKHVTLEVYETADI